MKRSPILLCLLLANAVYADVTMPAIFGDHMVLQQDAKLPVWGWASPGEKVSVTINNKRSEAVANAEGKWRVEMPALATNVTGQTLRIEGAKNHLQFNDVVVGEVWICSGQSNMGYPLRAAQNSAAEAARAADPQLRLFVVTQNCAAEPQENLTGRWELCTSENAGNFSAVGYFFGREMRKELKRPMGLIGTYWGGTPAQSWTSLAALEREPAFTKYVDQYRRALEIHKKVTPEMTANYGAEVKKWDDEYKAALAQYNAAIAAGEKVDRPKPNRPAPVQPDPMGVPNPAAARPGNPAIVFNAMLAPLIPYAIKGAIWYQGEANADSASAGEYHALFSRMIEDWRGRWGQGAFPFVFVQLPNYSAPASQDWPTIREAQLRTLALPNTGMAVAIGLGNPNDIHPRGKVDVGQRLALVARKVAYGQDIVYSGPIYDTAKVDGNKIRLHFKNIGSGLTMGVSPWMWDGSTPAKPEKLTGFTISGADQKWSEAQATIQGDEVVVSSDAVSAPVAVRYGWENNPACNLYNKEGLPASPFQTDPTQSLQQ